MFIIFCEVSPKRLAIHYANKVVLIGALPMLPVYCFAYPITFVLSRFSNQFISIFAEPTLSTKKQQLSKEEFLGYMKRSSKEGALQKIESSMLENLIINKDIPVKSFLIPRQDMKAFNLQALPQNLFKSIQQFPYSTIPVYDGLQDNVIGVLSKQKLASIEHPENISIKTFAKHLDKPKLIPESKRIIEVLRDMHETKAPACHRH